jgi:hypothetical protein
MNTNSGRNWSAEFEYLAHAFTSMYYIVFHPFSFQKYIDTLPQSEQRRRFKFLFIPIGLISFLVLSAGNSITNYFGEFPNAASTQVVQFAVLLCCGFYAVLSPSVEKGKFVTKALEFLAVTLMLPLMLSYFLSIIIENLYTRPFTDGWATPIFIGLVGGLVLGLAANATKLVKASKATFRNIRLYLLLHGCFQVCLIIGGSKNVGSTLMLLLFVIISFIVELRPTAWLRTTLSINQVNKQSIEQPERTLEFLKASRLGKDEFGVLPYPGLGGRFAPRRPV